MTPSLDRLAGPDVDALDRVNGANHPADLRVERQERRELRPRLLPTASRSPGSVISHRSVNSTKPSSAAASARRVDGLETLATVDQSGDRRSETSRVAPGWRDRGTPGWKVALNSLYALRRQDLAELKAITASPTKFLISIKCFSNDHPCIQALFGPKGLVIFDHPYNAEAGRTSARIRICRLVHQTSDSVRVLLTCGAHTAASACVRASCGY